MAVESWAHPVPSPCEGGRGCDEGQPRGYGFLLPSARHLGAVVLTGGEGPGGRADHVRAELSLLFYGASMVVVFGEGATKQVEVCTGRGLHLPDGGQGVLSCLNSWWLEEGEVME